MVTFTIKLVDVISTQLREIIERKKKSITDRSWVKIEKISNPNLFKFE